MLLICKPQAFNALIADSLPPPGPFTGPSKFTMPISLAEFPDFDTAQKCYNSEDYQEARKFLEGSVIREHKIFEGM